MSLPTKKGPRFRWPPTIDQRRSMTSPRISSTCRMVRGWKRTQGWATFWTIRVMSVNRCASHAAWNLSASTAGTALPWSAGGSPRSCPGANALGRTGLLAHPYMLGPNGDSFGCVSFRDYNGFLQAYKDGEVKQLAVVAHLNRTLPGYGVPGAGRLPA